MSLNQKLVATVLSLLASLVFSMAHAQEQDQSHFALPFEFDGDHGAPNGNALLLRLWSPLRIRMGLQ